MKSTQFINVLSVILSVVLILLFIILFSYTVSYMKQLAYKVKVILRAAFESKSPFLTLKKDIKRIKHTQFRSEVERNMRDFHNYRRGDTFRSQWALVTDKFNHLMLWPCSKFSSSTHAPARKSVYNLLKPPTRFFHLLNTTGVLVVWFVTILLAGLMLTYFDGFRSEFDG